MKSHSFLNKQLLIYINKEKVFVLFKEEELPVYSL